MDGSEIQLSKSALRRDMRARRDALSAKQHAAYSDHICRRVLALPAYQSATAMHIYLPLGSEVDVRAIISDALTQHKQVTVPLFEKHSEATSCAEITSLNEADFVAGDWGLRAPRIIRSVPIERIGLFIVPLLAFAPTQNMAEAIGYGKSARLGYGSGYYDRLLQRSRKANTPAVIGVAFALQRLPALPIAMHDESLDAVITDE